MQIVTASDDVVQRDGRAVKDGLEGDVAGLPALTHDTDHIDVEVRA